MKKQDLKIHDLKKHVPEKRDLRKHDPDAGRIIEKRELTMTYIILKSLLYLTAGVILTAAAIEDIRTMQISDKWSIGLLLLAILRLVVDIALADAALADVVLGAAAGALIFPGFMIFANLISQFASGPDSGSSHSRGPVFGGGDILLCFSAGAFLGWPGMMKAMLVSMVAAGAFAAAGLAVGKLKTSSAFPLGPFIAAGAIIVLIGIA